MFRKFKSFFAKSKSKSSSGLPISLSSDCVNLDTHPPCPKYLSFKITDVHHPLERRGVFTVEAAELLRWIIECDRNGAFEETFIEWLNDAGTKNTDVYRLSDSTAFKLNLEFFVDDALEQGRVIKTHCPACDGQRTNDDMKLIQESSGGWVYRMIDCKCGNRLASYEVMHFMLKAGAEVPKRMTHVVRDFNSMKSDH